LYSPGISTLRRVTSFFQFGARVLPVSVNHCQESGVGSAAGSSGFSATTGTMAGSLPWKPASRVGVELLAEAVDEVGADQRPHVVIAADQGTWATTALTRRSMAATTRT
jgi:hypothetical protein